MGTRRTAIRAALATIFVVLGPAAPAQAAPHAGGPAATVPWGASVSLKLDARPVSDPLATPAGPGFVRLAGAQQHAASGEGLIALTMAAPGTSWSSRRDPAAVVDVSVDGGAPQTIELFYGGRPFTYEGFLGPLVSGPHRVEVSSSSTLSAARDAPRVRIMAAQLGVVPATDPSYLADAYAPFIYGRSTSARRYIPLLTYVEQSSNGDGSHTLSYTYVISAHDQGDSIVPAYQWGTWGRMTDIVSIITETVSPSGAVTSASYSSCACEGTPYPDRLMSASDSTTKPFAGSWLAHHPMLRDATATNYLSDQGTTAYRFQQAPVAGPAGGEVREAVMDAHPWTYQVSNQELPREHVISTSPDNILVGDYRQYAIIDSDIATSGSDSVQVELRLAGDPTWYSTDYRQMTAQVPSTFAFHDGGHNRTVIKMPADWAARAIDAIRIRLTVTPRNPPATAIIHSLHVLEVTPQWTILDRPIPAPSVYQAPAVFPGPLPF